MTASWLERLTKTGWAVLEGSSSQKVTRIARPGFFTDDSRNAYFLSNFTDLLVSDSLGSLFLGESQSVKCSQVEYVTNEESDLGQGIVRCVELVLGNSHRVALDPMWTSGVRIGNTDPWFQENLSGSCAFRHHTEVHS